MSITMMSISSWRFLQEAVNVSEVANSKYHNLFFILLLNLSGFFSLSEWNFTQMAASFRLYKTDLDILDSHFFFFLFYTTYHSDGEVIIENRVGYRITRLTAILLLLVQYNFNLPPIHHDGRSPAYLAQDLMDGFALVATTPSETSGQIVPCPQWNDPDRWVIDKLDLVCKKLDFVVIKMN